MLKALLKHTPLWAVARRVRARMFPARGVAQNFVYDAQTIEVMRRVLRPGAVAVDVGAHSRQITREMIALAPGGRVLAFEPIPALAQEIRDSVPGAEVFEYALGDQAGPASFQHVVNDPSYSGLRQRDYDPRTPSSRKSRSPWRASTTCFRPKSRSTSSSSMSRAGSSPSSAGRWRLSGGAGR